MFQRTEENFFWEIESILIRWCKGIFMLGILIYSGIEFIRKKRTGFVIPIIVTVLNLIVIKVIQNEFEKREASPVVFQAHYDGDINGLTLYLRKNHTYKIDDFSILGGTCHYGKYILKGDTIVLSEKYPLGADRDIMGNKLLKTSDFVFIQTDALGHFKTENYIKLSIVKQ